MRIKKSLIINFLIFLAILYYPYPLEIPQAAWHTLAVAYLMLAWWITEALPIPVTSLLPLVALPLLDVMSFKETGALYGSPIIFLFFGGFILALALEKWALHKRIALKILSVTGNHSNGIIAGFMLATAFLSMWMSNTATTIMMLPIAQSVLTVTFKHKSQLDYSPQERTFGLALMLGIAYSANIGGMATLIGTPPNAVFAAFTEEQLNRPVTFLSWMKIGLPYTLVMLTICWACLVFIIARSRLGRLGAAATLIEESQAALGKIGQEARAVLIIFLCIITAWVFKGFLPFKISDAAIAIIGAFLFFIIPSQADGKALLCWEDTQRLPWGILLLFGGGLSLATALSKSGLLNIINQHLLALHHLPILALIAVVVCIVLVMTEVMSNVALISVMIPVLASVAQHFNMDAWHLLIPATLAASCAFMLPMSTPPNAIVFSSGMIRIKQMAKAGLLLNTLAILLNVTLIGLCLKFGWL